MNETNKNNDEILNGEMPNSIISNNQLPKNQSLDQLLDLQAKQIANMLDEKSNQLSLLTIKKLENARERAVQSHNQASDVNVNSNGTLGLTVSWAEQHRLATAGMVLVAITAGFLLMQSMSKPESSDAFLLGSDLPPEAFVDKGFAPSLNFKQAKI